MGQSVLGVHRNHLRLLQSGSCRRLESSQFRQFILPNLERSDPTILVPAAPILADGFRQTPVRVGDLESPVVIAG
jgi:hypothetical protein